MFQAGSHLRLCVGGDSNYVIPPFDKTTPTTRRVHTNVSIEHRKQGHPSRPASEIGLPCFIHPSESRRTCHVGGVRYVRGFFSAHIRTSCPSRHTGSPCMLQKVFSSPTFTAYIS